MNISRRRQGKHQEPTVVCKAICHFSHEDGVGNVGKIGKIAHEKDGAEKIFWEKMKNIAFFWAGSDLINSLLNAL